MNEPRSRRARPGVRRVGWLGLFLAGCATHSSQLVLDPVGPPPGAPSPSHAKGSLVVFSAFDATGHFNRNRQYHTDYQILSQEGKVLQSVHNDPGNDVGGPVQVDLPSGAYRVEARANGYGKVVVPVIIQGGSVTVVHLEGGGSWPNREQMIKLGAVRLPDGRVVGWSAHAATPSAP